MTFIAASRGSGDATFATPSKPSPSAGSPTRSRSRLLWRGSLLLQDGTPLRGLCFVSSIAPLFASSTPADAGSAADEDAEAELGLGLALETIRHAPIRIAKVLGGSEGSAALANVEWRSSGNIRMYIDPRETATLAYFERHFVYPEAGKASGRSQFTFLLSTGVSPSQPFAADPFRSTAIESSASGGQELALWATWDDPQGPAKLVVGRRIVKRSKASSSARSRPDDPAPRMRPLVTSSLGNVSQRAGFHLKPPARSLSKSRSTPNLVVDLTPVKEEEDEASQGPQRKRRSAGNHTPGRRGEKRPAKQQRSPKLKRERSASVMSAMSLPPSPKQSSSSTTTTSRIEADNRTAIKKLVHYQLLGRGIEKGSADYTACYSAACNGVFVAMRHSMSSSPIVSSHAARIVAAHLALYLDPLPEPSHTV